MKPIGVVRRVDDLGRIVIPKEIRKTLRIRDGEALEIFVEKDMIALKKYSTMKDLDDVSADLANSINQTLLKDVLVTDLDKVIATSVNKSDKYMEKRLSKYLENQMLTREIVIEKNIINIEFIDSTREKCSYVISPIISSGDAIGSVIVFSNTESISDLEVKMAALSANFLAKYIEQ